MATAVAHRATTPRRVQAAGHAIQLLDCFLDGSKTLGLVALSNELGLNKSNAYRLVETLVTGGLLARDPFGSGYTLGNKVVELAQQLGMRFALGETARPLLERLRDQIGETAALHINVGSVRFCVAQLPSAHPVRLTLELNHAYPLFRGAAGKVFLAYLPNTTVRELISPLPRPEQQRLLRQLAQIRNQGFAVSRGEVLPDTASVCAAVLSRAMKPIAMVGVHGPAYRMTDSEIPKVSKCVVSAAKELSENVSG